MATFKSLTIGKKLWILYIILLLLSILVIRSILKQDIITIKEETPTEKITEIKPAKVTLRIINGTTKNYQIRLKDNNSVEELLAEIRSENGFYYELVQHTSYIEILVDNRQPPENTSWRIFDDDIDITNQMYDTNLQDEHIYTLKLVDL